MPTIVKVSAKDLYLASSVEFVARISGSDKDIEKEFRNERPDPDWVDELFRPELVIYIDGAPSGVEVEVKDGKVVFICSPTYLGFLAGYCTAMDFHFDMVTE